MRGSKVAGPYAAGGQDILTSNRERYKRWPWVSFFICGMSIGIIFFVAGSPQTVTKVKGKALVLSICLLVLGGVLLLACLITLCLFGLLYIYHTSGRKMPRRLRKIKAFFLNKEWKEEEEEAAILAPETPGTLAETFKVGKESQERRLGAGLPHAAPPVGEEHQHKMERDWDPRLPRSKPGERPPPYPVEDVQIWTIQNETGKGGNKPGVTSETYTTNVGQSVHSKPEHYIQHGTNEQILSVPAISGNTRGDSRETRTGNYERRSNEQFVPYDEVSDDDNPDNFSNIATHRQIITVPEVYREMNSPSDRPEHSSTVRSDAHTNNPQKPYNLNSHYSHGRINESFEVELDDYIYIEENGAILSVQEAIGNDDDRPRDRFEQRGPIDKGPGRSKIGLPERHPSATSVSGKRLEQNDSRVTSLPRSSATRPSARPTLLSMAQDGNDQYRPNGTAGHARAQNTPRPNLKWTKESNTIYIIDPKIHPIQDSVV